MREFFATDYAYGVAPNVPGLQVTTGSTISGAAVSYIISQIQSVAAPPSQRTFTGPATNAPMLIGTGTIQETQTPSGVTALPVGQQSSISFTTVTNAHGNGTSLASGTVGLQEALNDCSALGGGTVIVDGRWAQLGGTTAMITSAANPSGSGVFITDWRGSTPAWYTWNGSAFTASAGAAFPAGANGQSFAPFANTELLTLSTTGKITQTVGNLLPANSIILAVTGTIQSSITGGNTTNWQLGDTGSAGRFSAVDTTLTAFENVPKTSFPPVQIGTGVVSATAGMYQAAAGTVYFTTTGAGNPTGGKVRITVYGFTLVNATS